MSINNILYVMLFCIFFNSCAIKVMPQSYSTLVKLEDKLIRPFQPKNSKCTRINSILYETLEELGLSSDYAVLKLIRVDVPTMYAGILKNIYVSDSMVNKLLKNELSDNNFRLLVMHEIFHKILNHPYKSLLKLSIKGSIIKPTFEQISNLASLAYVNSQQKLNSLKDFYTSYESIKLTQGFNQDYLKENEIMLIPYLGYHYSEEFEYDVDDMVVAYLKRKNENISSYRTTLELLKDIMIFDKTGLLNDSIKNLEVRINRLK